MKLASSRRDGLGSILFLNYQKLGDSLIMTPLFEGIKRCRPDARIAVISAGQGRQVFRNNPFIDKIIPCDIIPNTFSTFPRYLSLCRETVRRLSITTVICDVVNTNPITALLLRLLPVRHAILAGGLKPLFRPLALGLCRLDPVHVTGESVLKSNLRILERLGCSSDGLKVRIFPSSDDVAMAEKFYTGLKLDPAKKTISCVPFAAKGVISWPLENIAAFIKAARLRYNLIVFGGREEKERLPQELHTLDGVFTDFELGFVPSAVAIKKTDLLISVDTGPSHFFQWLGLPMLKVDPSCYPVENWGYPGDPLFFDLRHPVPCAHCMDRRCPKPGPPCLEQISAEEVLTMVERILGGSSATRG